MIKLCFIDTETTGADVMKHGLFSIGGIIAIDGVEKERFELFCDVFAEDEFDIEGMKKSGFTSDDIAKMPDPLVIYNKLTEILAKHVDKFNPKDKFFFIGYGAEFDNKFLRRWFESNGDQYFGSWFWFPWIDVMSLAHQSLMRKRTEIVNFQLMTVARYMGIKVDETKCHGALYDADLTMQIYKKIVPWAVEDKQIDANNKRDENITRDDQGNTHYKLNGNSGRKPKYKR